MKVKDKPKDVLKSVLAIVFLQIVALLPFRVSQALGRCIGWTLWRLNTRSARVTDINLALCYAEMNADERRVLARESLIQTGQTLTETASLWLGDPEKNRRRVSAVSGADILDEAIENGRGVIVILPHLGNWEMFNVYYNHRVPMTALYSPPEIKVFERFLDKVRNRFRNDVVPTTRNGLAQLYRVLKKGQVVTILPDQVPANGEFAPFFGQSAFTDVLIPRLVRKSGARVICAYVKRLSTPGKFEVVFKSADDGVSNSDLTTALKALNRSIEQCVNELREQYQWEYKRFRRRPQGCSKVY
jgi:KDO2-lipid IV(A) lauroyltransferase